MHQQRTATAVMENVQKSEKMASLYDLEYRSAVDDAWYSVYLILDSNAQTLTLNCLCSPKVYVVVLSASSFDTESQLEEFVKRFRPVSRQIQDHECTKLSVGTTVCAAHLIRNRDLRFYDAVIDSAERQPHSFSDGEEECLCNFILFWKHGRGCGTLTMTNIASICTAEPVRQLDPRISAFAIMAKNKISSSPSMSTRKRKCRSIKRNSELPRSRSVKMDISMMPKSVMVNSEDWGRTSQDHDMGPSLCNTNFILINNLEKDLTPLSIVVFIYKQTNILPQAFVFPRQLSDPFARAAIMVDSQKKVQIIYEFLENPFLMVVSSRGRPWVVIDKASAGTFRANIRNIIPNALDEIKYEMSDERTELDLQVVLSGTESYNRATKLRDLFLEYLSQESQLRRQLVYDEKRILRSCQPA